MTVGLAFRQMAVELVHIHPDIGLWRQVYSLPIDLHPIAHQGLVEGIDRPAQGSPSVLLVVFRPEQIDQGGPPLPFARYSQVDQKGDCLARVHL
jgi:hypothetical protein